MLGRCPCGSKKSFSKCCEPLIKGTRQAETAEELLRARYSAHVNIDVDYIIDTVYPGKKKEHDREQIREWASSAGWKNLDIIQVNKGTAEDSEGKIEFKANYTEEGEKKEHHEIAHFKKKNGKWYFLDGKQVAAKQFVRSTPKTGRNEPCPCGSGKKYKKCCGA